MIVKKCLDIIEGGDDIDFDLALELATKVETDELAKAADKLRHHIHGDRFDLCSIINAKSGKCSEDCRFCAQSAHYATDISTYDVIGNEEAVMQAKDSDVHGVERISLVTAGKSASMDDLHKYGEIYREMRRKTGLRFCASMGMLTREKAELLRSYGVERYHCNLETCRRFFPEVCSTHSWQEKVETIKIAREAGMDVCSGGIFGMGESLEHRIELAFELRELDVLSIPINVLTPIKNTPFEHFTPLGIDEVFTCIAVFRFINPRAVVRLAGGRNQLGEQQFTCFQAGANGAIVGNYLTTAGNNLEDDLRTIRKQGFTFAREHNE